MHEDFQGHTEDMMSLVKGAVSSFSQIAKKKISIEDDLIGVDESMAKILQSRYFIDAIAHNKIMHNNKRIMVSSPVPNLPSISRVHISL